MIALSQILSAEQMRAAEGALIAGGIGVDELMQRAGNGAADYVWRIAGPLRRITVLTGPGNNGGDGWVIAEAIRRRGGHVVVVPAAEPRTDAARVARSLYSGAVVDSPVDGDVLVDCLFGTGLTRGLGEADLALLNGLAARHGKRIAVDLPSGIATDTGAALNDGLPDYHLTIALGAWKPAHFLMPAMARMGELRLVDIGCGAVEDAGRVIGRLRFQAPAADAHKYRRGLLGVVAGAMPGAAVLAATAAQRAGAGYVKVLCDSPLTVPVDLVCARADFSDDRIAALLVGPGLGRNAAGHFLLAEALAAARPTVLDADGCHLLSKGMMATIATPHEGELVALEHHFGSHGEDKISRARNLAQASGMVIVAKGPDTIVAAPDGRWAAAPRASSWLSTAGTGDVLAGTIASRLANGAEPFAAACEGVWLHGEAARITPPPFSAGELAKSIAKAYRACL
ncbi:MULTISPECIES: NAD(P)H-hydrate epimerase [unclassified Novosphingobium]|uniref:NAD(P)H-hydrate epimerase n=1 Tax=unclassified Novosphingobium TaxID=2644732 RepID=UPI0008686BF0|nr:MULTISPECIES: NAD(P)H-hydrate epimerase [unclassified Novosphingobium]MBN9144176.1 NAD(P)H-hydrate epimerase [Novosphingobium sp.]MDR6708491.1 hydroxyethylthiazole kinase-like uncharacterized protein yjeF [Novosphingobium sp. 1748]ODU81196.1 MAG: NAD(P)H-hydrate epimerase [Novosphingobium sp. SCN 63-17]OJX95007.1 MAG: NAD(P)H-hydrate epimerase [Novosphingobium sp. 63-713]